MRFSKLRQLNEDCYWSKMATKRGVYLQPPSGSKEHAIRPQIAIAEPSAEVRCAKDPRPVEKYFASNRTFACRITCDAPFVLPVSAARLRLYNHLKSAPHLHPSVDSARAT